MAFKMNYTKGRFPFKKTNLNNPDDNVKPNPTVYATVDSVPLTYGEYLTYDKTGKMPSGSKSRRNQTDVDLSEIIKKEEARGIVQPVLPPPSDEPIPGDEDYVENN